MSTFGICNHNSKIGDNYGLSCADCGKQLEGYGEFGHGDGTCMHNFVDHWDAKTPEQICTYCERTRKKVYYKM